MRSNSDSIDAMSKITFRADDELVEQLEALEISKSEAMREALRSYLGAGESTRRGPDGEPGSRTGAVDDLIRDRVDELLADRLHELESRRGSPTRDAGDVTITVSLDDGGSDADRDPRIERADPAPPRGTERGDAPRGDDGDHQACDQCGEAVADDHVYCPNCGEKASRRLFCECGDEVRSDWSFCPGCGRRTPAADVLENDRPT